MTCPKSYRNYGGDRTGTREFNFVSRGRFAQWLETRDLGSPGLLCDLRQTYLTFLNLHLEFHDY